MSIAKAVVTGNVFRAPEKRFTSNNVPISAFVLNIGDREELLIRVLAKRNSLDEIVSSQIGQQLFTALQFGNTKDVIDGFKELLNDDEEGEKVAKEFIKAQLPKILGEGEDDE